VVQSIGHGWSMDYLFVWFDDFDEEPCYFGSFLGAAFDIGSADFDLDYNRKFEIDVRKVGMADESIHIS
jgi:hypothetical protein